LRRPRVAGYQHEERGDEVDSKAEQDVSNEVRGSEMITGRLKELVEADELVF
jgi:hypothetical protein